MTQCICGYTKNVLTRCSNNGLLMVLSGNQLKQADTLGFGYPDHSHRLTDWNDMSFCIAALYCFTLQALFFIFSKHIFS